MNKEKKVINFYLLCNKLKNTIRAGWLDWNIKRDRVESIAEHIYGVQMLAIAMYSEYKYDVDIKKVIYMIAIHEIGETIIGDLTDFDMSKDEKKKKEHEAVHNILSDLIDAKEIEDLFLEYDAHITNESKFAYQCDKLECDIQCKIYDEEHCVDPYDQENSKAAQNGEVKQMLEENKSWSQLWHEYGRNHYPYDKNFLSISNYLDENDIL